MSAFFDPFLGPCLKIWLGAPAAASEIEGSKWEDLPGPKPGTCQSGNNQTKIDYLHEELLLGLHLCGAVIEKKKLLHEMFLSHLGDNKFFMLSELFQIGFLLIIIGTLQILYPVLLIPAYMPKVPNTNCSKVFLWLTETLSHWLPASTQQWFIYKILLVQEQSRQSVPKSLRAGRTRLKHNKIIAKLTWIVIDRWVIPFFSAVIQYFWGE